MNNAGAAHKPVAGMTPRQRMETYYRLNRHMSAGAPHPLMAKRMDAAREEAEKMCPGIFEALDWFPE